MNSVQLTGRLTKEPDFRTSQNGAASVRFTLAVPRTGGKDSGADFVSCIAFNKQAEFIKQYFTKGQKMDLTGRIMTGTYTGADGKKVYTTNVCATTVEFGESKARAASSDSPTTSNSPMDAPSPGNDFADIPSGIDELVPF